MKFQGIFLYIGIMFYGLNIYEQVCVGGDVEFCYVVCFIGFVWEEQWCWGMYLEGFFYNCLEVSQFWNIVVCDLLFKIYFMVEFGMKSFGNFGICYDVCYCLFNSGDLCICFFGECVLYDFMDVVFCDFVFFLIGEQYVYEVYIDVIFVFLFFLCVVFV